MKNKLKVRWSHTAEKCLLAIIEHIAEDSPANARKVFEKIRREAKDLYFFPERGRIVPELERQNFHVFREVVVPPWRIVYRFNEEFVNIIGVFDSRQNFEDILLKLILNP